jgi:uncharacterized protein
MRYITAAIIGLAFIIGLFVIGNAYKSRAKSQQSIGVTGSAEKDFVSDLIVWKGSYSRKSMDLKNAYADLKNDENSIRAYLSGKGIPIMKLFFLL